MGFFRHSDDNAAPAGDSKPTLRVTAMVIDVNPPAQNYHRFAGPLLVVADLPSGRRPLHRSVWITRDRWLVPGMQVPIAVDSDDPEHFDVDWDSIPAIEQRVAAQDPTLVDPRAAHGTVLEAISTATVRGEAALEEAHQWGQPDHTDGFDSAMSDAASKPAPDGKARAVILVATMRFYVSDTDTDYDRARAWPMSRKGAEAVLSVNVPGRVPYAVLEPALKFPRSKPSTHPWCLPAFVSLADDHDIEIVWDEVPDRLSRHEQNKRRKQQQAAGEAAGRQLQQERIAQMNALAARLPGAITAEQSGVASGALTSPGVPTQPSPATEVAGLPGLPGQAPTEIEVGGLQAVTVQPQAAGQTPPTPHADLAQQMTSSMQTMPLALREMMMHNVKRSLKHMTPETREATISLYRSMGIEL
jgi:hypothetical protein